MAMSPEDMEKRRQRRQAQLKKQRAQRRKLRLGLAAPSEGELRRRPAAPRLPEW